MTQPSFAARLFALRTRAGVTQAELAERSGVTQALVSQLEAGDHGPSWSTVQALAAALGVGVEEFTRSKP